MNEELREHVEAIKEEISKHFSNPVLIDVYERTARDIAYGGGPFSDPGFGMHGTMTLYENVLKSKGFLGLGKKYYRRMLCAITPRSEGKIPVLIISDVKDKIESSIKNHLRDYQLDITIEPRLTGA